MPDLACVGQQPLMRIKVSRLVCTVESNVLSSHNLIAKRNKSTSVN